MKSASAELTALLNGGVFEMADLWTLTLSGGSVLRWSGADIPLVANGQTYLKGPGIDRGQITEKRGLEVATLDMQISANSSDQINGVPLIQFIRKRGLDGATLRLDRAFLADWASGVVGTIWRFGGRVTAIPEISGSTAKVTVSSWTILLDVNMPPNLCQAACLHTLFDGGCGLNRDSFAASGSVSGIATATTFGSSVTGNDGRFAQGRIKFTSGANAGITRSIKSNDGAGSFVLIQALPTPPAAGDSFTVYPGCDLTKATCAGKFNNLGRFKGTPFVPVPETAV